MARMMTEEARAAYNAYQREWRKAHPETVRAYRKKHAATFWEKKAREAAEAAAAAAPSGKDPEELTRTTAEGA